MEFKSDYSSLEFVTRRSLICMSSLLLLVEPLVIGEKKWFELRNCLDSCLDSFLPISRRK